jgi:hypothetical protein
MTTQSLTQLVQGDLSPRVKLAECEAVCAQDIFYDHKNKHGEYSGKHHLIHGPELMKIIFQMCNICSRVIIVQQKKTTGHPYKNVYLFIHLQ